MPQTFKDIPSLGCLCLIEIFKNSSYSVQKEFLRRSIFANCLFLGTNIQNCEFCGLKVCVFCNHDSIGICKECENGMREETKLVEALL